MKNYSCFVVVLLFLVVCLLASAGCIQPKDYAFPEQEENKSKTVLPESEIVQGLKEALKVCSENVVARLGKQGGYYQDPKAHIPLPESLQGLQGVLDRAGLGRMLTDLELRMNRAAEMATPQAEPIFLDAISEMTLDEARNILNGPDDAATRYFQNKMSQPLAAEFTPIIRTKLSEAGAVRSYENIMGEYQKMPFVPDVSADLTSHVVDYSLQAIFDYLAAEEASIRNNPVKRTSDILRRVFGRS